jgi:diguanylate cyclase (GGDEF)-like protein
MTSEAPPQRPVPFGWWREAPVPARRLTALMLLATGVLLGVAIALLPSHRPLAWWVVLPLLWLGAVLSARRVTTAGLHRGGRDVLILPVGQYLFAAALLLDPISIAVLAVSLPSLRPPPRSIIVRCNRILTMLASSAAYWLLVGDRHPRIGGDGSWWLVLVILAAMMVHSLAESLLVSLSARVAAGTPARDTNIWTPYHALRDFWELAIGAVGAVLALVDPPLVLLMIPVLVLAVEHIRLEGETKQSRVDPRTDLLNVRGFEELAAKEIERATDRGRPLSLLVADLDHLREVNNAHGHRAGDAAISVVGRRILASTRRDDVVARVGGEEFVALLPDVGMDVASKVAERMRASVADSPVEAPSGRLLVTLSIGVAEWRPGETLEQLFDRADAAMYVAKQGGRNRVCTSDD